MPAQRDPVRTPAGCHLRYAQPHPGRLAGGAQLVPACSAPRGAAQDGTQGHSLVDDRTFDDDVYKRDDRQHAVMRMRALHDRY